MSKLESGQYYLKTHYLAADGTSVLIPKGTLVDITVSPNGAFGDKYEMNYTGTNAFGSFTIHAMVLPGTLSKDPVYVPNGSTSRGGRRGTKHRRSKRRGTKRTRRHK